MPVPVPHTVLDEVSNGVYYDPHEVLGAHLDNDGMGPENPAGSTRPSATVRVLRPLAKTVEILTQDGTYKAEHEWNAYSRPRYPL